MTNAQQPDEKACPLCKAPATVILPVWSGGRLDVNCTVCGQFETNLAALEAFNANEAEKEQRLAWFREAIKNSPTKLHITKGRHNYVGPQMHEERLTKWQKKLRRRGKSVIVGTVQYSGPVDDKPPNSSDS